MARATRDGAVFTVVVTALVLVCAVPMTVIVGLSGAPRGTVLAALLAAVPVGPLVACFLWLDRYEPEPRRLLAGGLVWGVFVATAVALLLEGVGGFVGGLSDKRMLELGAPLAEEASKGLFLVHCAKARNGRCAGDTLAMSALDEQGEWSNQLREMG